MGLGLQGESQADGAGDAGEGLSGIAFLQSCGGGRFAGRRGIGHSLAVNPPCQIHPQFSEFGQHNKLSLGGEDRGVGRVVVV